MRPLRSKVPILPHRATIVVADEQAFARRLVRSSLAGLGRIIECRTGFEALEATEQHRPAVLVMSRQLYGLDGHEVTQFLRRAGGDIRFTPVVLMSSDTRHSAVMGALSAGIHEFVARPFSLTGLRLRVEKVLRETRPFVRTAAFFGPVPRSRTVVSAILPGGDQALDTLTCVLRRERATPASCPLGSACKCRPFARSVKDLVEL